MNDKKRKKLRQAADLLDAAFNIVSSVYDDERDCLDNLSGNLEYSYMYEKMEEAIDHLEDASSSIESARDNVLEATV